MSPLLQVENLSKSFDGLTVTDGVSLTLSPGERVALIGPNGAGKTTLVNLVTGLLSPDRGRVVLAGKDVTALKPAERVRRGLIRSFQVTRLFADMTSEEHVALAVMQRLGVANRLFGHYARQAAVMAEVGAILEPLGLCVLAHRPVREIAYGQQRLVEIAIAQALRPAVLLLDEPAAGVPHAEMGRIERALDALPRELAVLMIDHDMDLVFRFARRVIVLAAGRVIFDGTPEAVQQDRLVREAYLGNYGNAGRRA